MNIKNKRTYSLTLAICIFVTALYAGSLFVLFRGQASLDNVKYMSDLPAHILAGLSSKGSYSLMYIILGFLWRFPYHSCLISLFLITLTLLSIYFTFVLLRNLLPKVKNENLYAAALVCNMYMPIFLPFFNDYRYMGMPSFVLYHNSTYIAMRPFAILSILVFIKLREKYALEKINFEEWLVFAFLMFVTTWFKPNFMFGFAPCMLIIMIVDFIKGHGKNVLNYIIFGSTVFPSVFLMLWQQKQLFNEDAGAGLGFSFFLVWGSYARHPLISIIQALAFPLVVLAFNYKDLLKDKVLRFGWLFTILNLSIFAFINENGSRKLHGNMGWGALFAVGVLFIISMYKFISTLHIKGLKYTIIVSGVLGMHILCWFNYYTMFFR